MRAGGDTAGGSGIGGVMRRRWVAVSPLTPLRETLQLMRMARLRQLPVVAEGVLRGMLSYRALVEAVLAGNASCVEEAMAPEVEAGHVAMPVAEAAARIARSTGGCLPVVEEGPDGPRLVGLVTEGDLLRLAYDPERAPGPA